ncbi:hypothetical protein [Mycolicibacterium sp.]|uniref:hypothetical protein n=1 Tax=Mycolicibacterium sp. TaxID=2320850 RepID=UPI0028AA5105|nr:hypothetical protein [Mycolicibacterium sp.]
MLTLRSVRLASALAAAAVVGLAAAGPVSADTPADTATVRTGATTPITGVGNDGSFLGGYFTATDFDIDPAGRLVANGTMTGTLTAAGMLQRQFSQPATLPVDRQETSPTNCRMVGLALGPAQTTVNGVGVAITQTELTVTMSQGPGSRQMIPLCDVATRVRDPNATDPGLINALNEIVRMAATVTS